MAGVTYTIDFVAQIARLEAETKQGAQSVKKMADDMEGYANTARNALAAIGVGLSIGAFSSAVKAAAEAADAAAKMGDRFGIATEKMIGMQHAGALAGVSNEALANAMRGVALQGTEAARGSDLAWRAFERLGINALEFVKLPMDKQLELVVDRLGQVTNVALRNALAQQVMGKAAGEAIRLVSEGSGAFQQATEDAKAWGLAVNRVDAAKIEMMNDAMTRVQASTRGLYTIIATALAPVVATLANEWADASAKANGHRDAVKNGMDIAVQAVAYTANGVVGLKAAYLAVKLVIAEVVEWTLKAAANTIGFLGEVGKWTQYIPGAVGVVGKAWKGLADVTGDSLHEMAGAVGGVATEIKAELDDLAAKGLPADRIIARFREITAAVQAEAEKIAKQRAAMAGSGESIDPDKPRDEGTWKKALQQRLAQVQQGYASELEILTEHRRASNKVIQDSLDAQIITETQAQAISARNFEFYERQKTAIQRREDQARLSSLATGFGNIAVLMQSHRKSEFEIGKKAAIAQAIVQTWQTASAAADEGSKISYYYGVALAAAAVVAGLFRVQQIQSTSFEGGGAAATYSAAPGTSIPSGPAAAEPPPPGATMGIAAPARSRIDITLINQGIPLDPSFVRDLAEQLYQQSGYGVDVIVNSGT